MDDPRSQPAVRPPSDGARGRSRSRPTERSRSLRRVTLAGTAAAALAAVAVLTPGGTPAAQAAPPGERDVTAVLFSWDFASVAEECAERLGPAGYGYVQVSPPQEHVTGPEWWTQYQPVSYDIAGRLGDEDAFRAMVAACDDAGVGVIVDAVVNHMSAGSGTGTGGTEYTKYDYPGFYSDADFNDCREDIADGDYTNDAWRVQNCELVGLADLATGDPYVQETIAGYLNDLLDMGVAGFRVDAVKHVPPEDLADVRALVGDGDTYWKQEVIYGEGEAIHPDEYLGTGDVQEFRHAFDLKRVFQEGDLAHLSDFGENWGYLPDGQATVFVDNHDTERNDSTLSYRDGSAYTLAQVFMLAWPYGSPDIHSGYRFDDYDAGPPNGGAVNDCWEDGWECQHAWPEVEAMVDFRASTAGTGVTDWWDNGGDAIAFGRDDQGFVVVNHEDGDVTETFHTSLSGGDYCDVQSGETVTVGDDGSLDATVASGTALALHTGARSCAE